MSEWVATLLVAAFALVGNAFISIYYYGRLSQRVDSQEKRQDSTDADQHSQWVEISHLREDVGKIKGKLGLNGKYQ